MVSTALILSVVVTFVGLSTVVIPAAYYFTRPKSATTESSNTTITENAVTTSTISNVTFPVTTISASDTTTVTTFIESTSTSSVSTTTTTTTTSSPIVTSNYSSTLNTSSSQFCYTPPCLISQYFYEALLLNITVDGNYSMRSYSSMNTFGLLYMTNFEPTNPALYLVASDDNGAGNSQFMITYSLIAGRTYILVATTYNQRTTGNFTIRITGVGPVQITRANTVYSYPVSSVYRSALTVNSSRFNRLNSTAAPTYYYQALLLSITTTGHYFIQAISNMDTFGLMYTDSFNASAVNQNLFTTNDDAYGLNISILGGGDANFGFAMLLDTITRYILVATTYSSNVLGSFSIAVNGSGTVGYTKI